MSPHSLTLLVAAVFAAQILVVSFYCPWRLYRAWLELRRNYPARDFPRLYPIEPDKTTRLINILQILNVVIGVVAIAILAFNLVHGTEAHHLVGIMIFTYMGQFLPALLRVPLQVRMQRAFRSMPAPTVRSAELRQWRLTEFVPPFEVALGIAIAVLVLACSAYFYFNRGTWFHGPGNILPLLAYSAAFSGLVLWRMVFLLSGTVTLRRPDPYMSEADVIRSRKFRLTLPFRMAMLLGLYFIFMQLFAAGWVRLDFVYVMTGASILGQLLYLRFTHLSLRALAARDLSAYRVVPDAGAKKEEAAAASS